MAEKLKALDIFSDDYIENPEDAHIEIKDGKYDEVAVITYTYNDVALGTASLDFTAAEKGSSVFRENTAETTESAEESGATDETQSGTTTTEADNRTILLPLPLCL